ncbi:TVP38/TMEM64 family protein [Pararhodospirillum photometricum]|nr:VTT domain-containing protein [Pararhodospirillum photometricum]
MMQALRIALAATVLLLALGGALYQAGGGLDPTALAVWAQSLAQTSGHAWVLLLLAQVLIAAAGILPASLLCLLSGTLFGFWAGFGLSSVGTFLGAFLSFALTRSFLRPALVARLERLRRFRRVDTAFAAGGWRLVCLARLSPVMPFALTSLSLGLSSVRFREYALGTLACLPAMAGYVAAGTLLTEGLGAWQDQQETLGWLSAGVGAVATVGLVAYGGHLLARALRGAEAS